MASVHISAVDWLMRVMAGLRKSMYIWLSNATIDTSSGMCSPSSCTALIVPRSMVLLSANMAVGGLGELNASLVSR